MSKLASTFRGTVALSALAVTAENKAPEWVQLTPVTRGTFKSVDGRTFVMKDPDAVVRQSLARGPIPIDANHATDTAAKQGMPAPAAAWIDRIALHGPANEDGLWGHVERWTPSGDKAVADREYRFLSPVLMAAKADGEIISIPRAALTNDPALMMTGLFHLNQETNDVDLKELCSLLGLDPSATIDQVRAKLASLVQTNAAMCARETALIGAAGLSVKVLDEATTVALCAKLKAPAGDATEIAKLQVQVTELGQKLNAALLASQGRDAKAEVEAAIAAGKLAPSLKDWGLELCGRDPEAFKKFVGAAPVIVRDGKLVTEQADDGALTHIEKDVCSAMGVSEDDFKKTAAAQRLAR